MIISDNYRGIYRSFKELPGRTRLIKAYSSTDTGENVKKWTRVFSTRRWVILVARTRRKKRRKILVSTFGRFRLWTSFESSPVSVSLYSPVFACIRLPILLICKKIVKLINFELTTRYSKQRKKNEIHSKKNLIIPRARKQH